MDSLTQIALGASVCGVLLSQKMGRKALLVGAIVGTVPDLDVVIPYGDDIANFTYHRGFTHSILFCLFMTWPLAWLFSRFKSLQVTAHDLRFNLTIFLILLTHILLDAMTIYGTQLFWPSQIQPVGLGSVFIIDPMYTLPMLIALGLFLGKPHWHKAISAGLVISTLYLVWSAVAQNTIERRVMAQLPDNITTEQVLVQPTVLNTLLWRILVMQPDGYQVAYYSVFDRGDDLRFKSYDSDHALLTSIADSFGVKRLRWFTKGLYAVDETNNQITITDLRMGMEPNQYVFSFAVGQRDDLGQITQGPNSAIAQGRDMGTLSKIWARIWDENIGL